MKIEAKSDYHGVPLIKIRDLLRKNRDGFGGERFCRNFEGKDGLGERILSALTRDGYVERDRICDGEFELTAKGHQMANATAARKVKRLSVERALGKMMARVEEVNADPGFLFRITDIRVFGKYLEDVDALSDVDLCVTLLPKHNNFDFEKISKARIQEEMSHGRRFRNIRAQVAWPRQRVLDHLRGKEGRLCIVEDDDLIPEDAEWDYLYRIESGRNVQQFPELEKPEK